MMIPAVLFKSVLLLQCYCTIATSYEIKKVLDKNVWESSVVTHTHSCSRDGYLPYICEFSNVFVDLARVYLIPKAEAAVTAAVDLYECCKDVFQVNEKPDDYVCNGSVHRNVCFCFDGRVQIPSVWSPIQMSKVMAPIEYLKGSTWLMNHFVLSHHPDHFNMKLLELHNLIAISKQYLYNSTDCYRHFPQKFDRMVSMDYPSNEKDRTDYEKLIMKIVRQKIDIPLTSLNVLADWKSYWGKKERNRTVFEPLCTVLEPTKSGIRDDKFSHLCKISYQSRGKGRSKAVHLEYAVSSPYYKNNIPYPFNYSMAALESSIDKVMKAEKAAGAKLSHCIRSKPLNVSNTVVNVAVIQRVEGKGQRRFVNLDSVLRAAQSTFKLSKVSVLYIDSSTPALMQVGHFCDLHLIVSPHSSHLSNVIFCPPNIAIIELLPQTQKLDTTFKNLAENVGIYYQGLGNPIYPEPRSAYEREYRETSWRTQNMLVNLPALQTALQQARQHLQREGYIV